MLPQYNIGDFSSGGAVFALALSRERRRLGTSVSGFDWWAMSAPPSRKSELHRPFLLQSDRPLLGARPRFNTARKDALMSKTRFGAAIAVSLIGALVASQADAQSASNSDAEIAALKQQLRLMERKLDRLQQQTSAKADAKVSVASANAAVPVKGPVAPSDAVVTMPNNRPTICTADDRNCIAITSRVHFDAGGYK